MLKVTVVRQKRRPFGFGQHGIWAANLCFFIVVCLLGVLSYVSVDRNEYSSNESHETAKPNLVQQRLFEVQNEAFLERQRRRYVRDFSPRETDCECGSGDDSMSGSGSGSGSGMKPCVCPSTTTTTSTTTTATTTTTMSTTTTTPTTTTTTTTPTTTTPTTTPTTTTPTTTTPTTTTPTTTSTTTPTTSQDTTTPTTAETTTTSEGGIAAFLLAPAVIAGIVVGALAVAGIMYCKKKMTASKYKVAETEPKLTEFEPAERPGPSDNLQQLSAKEDMLKDAMGQGSIAVLDFAIKQSTEAGLLASSHALVTQAKSKLNEWRRAQFQLQTAYNERDLRAMEDYVKRFHELSIKDETGVYEKANALQTERNSFKAQMRAAANQRNEDALVSSIDRFRKLDLPGEYVANDSDFLAAQKTLADMRQQRLLQGKSHREMRAELREAVRLRDRQKIVEVMGKFEEAKIADNDGDLGNAKRVLKEIETEQLAKRDTAWQKMQDASQTRDGARLREAIRECRKSGVPESDVRDGERLLRQVEREDQLLHQMRELMVQKDTTKLMEAVAVFRTPGLQLVDKTGDVKRADDLLQQLREQERMNRAKGDAMWRLRNARNVGDIQAMDAMIKALESLASAGVEVDEATILRAKTELESLRGAVDYRTRMESLKTAMSRSIKAENLTQMEDLIDQMVGLASDEKFAMTTDDTRVLDQSRDVLHDLKRKHAIMHDIEVTRPMLQVPLLPGMVEKLAEGVATMIKLKAKAVEFPGIFTPVDEELLSAAVENSADLKRDVEKMTAARQRLTAAAAKKDYAELAAAIAQAEDAPFIESETLEGPRELARFLDPVIRTTALKTAMASRSIPDLTKAIEDFKSARVPDQDPLLAKGERTLGKLKRLERKQAKAEIKRKKQQERREAEIQELNSRLMTAIATNDTYRLQEALDLCENSGYRQDEIPLYEEAEKLFDQLTVEDLSAKLKDGIERRDIQLLENTIDEIDYGGFVADLEPLYSSAKDLLFSLRELHSLREQVAGMNRSLISEIQRYRTPPQVVHTVMTAVLMLLGETQRQATNWLDIQAIVGRTGRDSLARRVKRNAPGDVPLDLCERIESVLGDIKVEDAAAKSSGAGTFFAWVTCTIKEARSLHYLKAPEELPPTPDLPSSSSSM